MKPPRRILSPFLAALAFTFNVAMASVAAAEESITVYTAKKIVTMDRTNPEATAVAVRGKRVVAVGSMADLKPWLEEHSHHLDETFADKVLFPGLIDPHLHPISFGL